jgi:hypothetical protein
MPTVTKNRPSRMSRNGRMSASTWWRYTVSEISMPPTKAPSASDSPLWAVRKERPTTIHSVVSTSSSLERRAPRHRRPAHQLLPDPDQQRQHGDHLRRGHGQRAPQVIAGGGQRRQQDQAGHHGEVLEQQHAHGLAPRPRVQFEAVGQHLGDDGGRRHRHGQADRDAAAPALVVGQGGDQPGAERGERHLAPPKPNTRCAWPAGAWQAELEADGEHQEHHAELGEAFHFRSPPAGRGRAGPWRCRSPGRRASRAA